MCMLGESLAVDWPISNLSGLVDQYRREDLGARAGGYHGIPSQQVIEEGGVNVGHAGCGGRFVNQPVEQRRVNRWLQHGLGWLVGRAPVILALDAVGCSINVAGLLC